MLATSGGISIGVTGPRAQALTARTDPALMAQVQQLQQQQQQQQPAPHILSSLRTGLHTLSSHPLCLPFLVTLASHPLSPPSHPLHPLNPSSQPTLSPPPPFLIAQLLAVHATDQASKIPVRTDPRLLLRVVDIPTPSSWPSRYFYPLWGLGAS